MSIEKSGIDNYVFTATGPDQNDEAVAEITVYLNHDDVVTLVRQLAELLKGSK